MDFSTPIDILNYADITPEDFKENYISVKKPALIKGILDYNPKARSWTLDKMYDKLGEQIINVYDDTKINGTSNISTHLKVPMKTMLDLIKNNQSSKLRMFINPVLKYDKELYKEIQCPSFFKCSFQLSSLLFLGGKNCIVPLHYGFILDDGLLTQLFGRKEIILIDNEQSKLLNRLPFNTTSLVNLFEPDFIKYPSLKRIKGYRLMLEHGDTVYIPSTYWHQLKYIDGSMSVGFRKWNLNPFLTFYTAAKRISQISFDKSMHYVLGQKWLKYKENVAAVNSI